jgi:hypothetical protein
MGSYIMASSIIDLFSNKEVAKDDKFFIDYAKQAQQYLDRDVFKGTPMTGQMLADAAKEAYKQTGKIVPVDLALSQAQFESSMGRKGRNPLTNPYNVGEFDEGTKQSFKDTASGVKAYYKLMASDYLRDKTSDQLMQNFTNYRGDRYASNKKYEDSLREQSGYIKKFLGNMPKETQGTVSNMSSFDKAFASARAGGKKTFEFGGKLYKVEMK